MRLGYYWKCILELLTSQYVPTTKLPSKRQKEKPEFSYRVPSFNVYFVLVMCETIVCFYEYHFESLYDPLGTFRKNTSYTKRRCIYTFADIPRCIEF